MEEHFLYTQKFLLQTLTTSYYRQKSFKTQIGLTYTFGIQIDKSFKITIIDLDS